jgi:hypothetical protein
MLEPEGDMSGPYRIDPDNKLTFEVRGPDGYFCGFDDRGIAEKHAEVLNEAYELGAKAGAEKPLSDAAVQMLTEAHAAWLGR